MYPIIPNRAQIDSLIQGCSVPEDAAYIVISDHKSSGSLKAVISWWHTELRLENGTFESAVEFDLHLETGKSVSYGQLDDALIALEAKSSNDIKWLKFKCSLVKGTPIYKTLIGGGFETLPQNLNAMMHAESSGINDESIERFGGSKLGFLHQLAKRIRE